VAVVAPAEDVSPPALLVREEHEGLATHVEPLDGVADCEDRRRDRIELELRSQLRDRIAVGTTRWIR
jgi:hypothetical protein